MVDAEIQSPNELNDAARPARRQVRERVAVEDGQGSTTPRKPKAVPVALPEPKEKSEETAAEQLSTPNEGRGDNSENHRLYTTEEMARLLRLSAVEVDRMRQRGELAYVRVAGQIRFPLGLQKFRIEGGEHDGEIFAAATIFDNQQTVMHVAAPMPYDALDEQEVARLLKCELKTVLYYSKRSNQLAYVSIGKKRLVLRKDLEDFLRRRRVRSPDEIPLREKERNQ
jgi:hypothetical protein